jgi:beta-phosphoglucomutase-like phosphatase (HAD superfamily)
MPKPFVMFDVEGTLVDCARETLACWSRTFRQFGFEFSAAELHPHSGREVKIQRPEALITYVRRQNKRGDTRHPVLGLPRASH